MTPPTTLDIEALRRHLTTIRLSLATFGYTHAATTLAHTESVIDTLVAQRTSLMAEAEGRRMCVTCGRYAPLGADQYYQDPACDGPDGMNPCLFDMTAREAADYWKQQWHDQRDTLEKLRAEIVTVANGDVLYPDADSNLHIIANHITSLQHRVASLDTK